MKLFQSKFVDRVLTCPSCGSPEVYAKYTCPKYNSHNVEYTELLEHMKCGYIGSKDNFTKGSSLVCPGWQAELTEEAIHYGVIGSCYQCEKCGYRFDKPDYSHKHVILNDLCFLTFLRALISCLKGKFRSLFS